MATFACQMPSLRMARMAAGAGATSTNAGRPRTSRPIEKMSVMLGLMTMK
jgi:hypothetical protein